MDRLNPLLRAVMMDHMATRFGDGPTGEQRPHPWREIDLEIYESHMSAVDVGQLQTLRQITDEQLKDHQPNAVAVLGVAGGNGLDLIDTAVTDAVFGYDVNPQYLAACETRYRGVLGPRLTLVEGAIERTMAIEPVDLVIANLLIEYVGLEEFVAFVAANMSNIGALSSAVQRNDTADFVSDSVHSSSFEGLASIATDIDPDLLELAMRGIGVSELDRFEYPLPNGKTLVRQDFRVSTLGAGQ